MVRRSAAADVVTPSLRASAGRETTYAAGRRAARLVGDGRGAVGRAAAAFAAPVPRAAVATHALADVAPRRRVAQSPRAATLRRAEARRAELRHRLRQVNAVAVPVVRLKAQALGRRRVAGPCVVAGAAGSAKVALARPSAVPCGAPRVAHPAVRLADVVTSKARVAQRPTAGLHAGPRRSDPPA